MSLPVADSSSSPGGKAEPSPLVADLRFKLVEAYHDSGVTQQQIADKLGITRSAVSKRLASGTLSVTIIEELLGAMGYELSVIMHKKEDKWTF